MAVREFDGTDDVINLGLGACATLGGGDFTLAFLIKMSELDGAVWWLGNAGLDAPRVFAGPFSFNWVCTTDGSSFANFADMDPNDNTIFDDGWHLAGFTRVAGSGVTPRGHAYFYDDPGWTHAAASAAMNNATETGATMNLGRSFGASMGGRLAVVGVWDSVLSDGDFEGLVGGLQAWVDLNPTGLWALNQASTATAVEDLTGNGADETSLTGTTVITVDDPPGFDFELAEPQVMYSQLRYAVIAP